MRFRKVISAPPVVDPFKDESTVGNILMRLHKVTREQLLQAVGVQSRTNEHLLGALLIELGYCTPADVAKALTIQAKIRCGDRAAAALDMLDDVVAEAEGLSTQLANAIQARRSRVRQHRQNTDAFFAPVLALKTSA
jgi:hypothetical protein